VRDDRRDGVAGRCGRCAVIAAVVWSVVVGGAVIAATAWSVVVGGAR